MTMTGVFKGTFGLILRAAMCFALTGAVTAPCAGQGNKVTETAGVDNTRMGAYRALAQLSFRAFQKGDSAAAATLARILERTWDQGEWKNSSAGSFCTVNRPVCQPIDKALDGFIGPLIDYAAKAPDPVTVQAAYSEFLDKLKQGEQ
jgi:hypothetical protein